jgi:hypothetical protein
MRNQHANGAAVDRAAEGPHEIIECCFQRLSDAHLRQNGKVRWKNCASARDSRAAIVTLIDNANCTRR